MKNLLFPFTAIILSATSCTKNNHSGALDDSIVSSSNRHSTPEDNHISGGGDDVNSSSLPVAVWNAFKSRYPDASRAEWKKQSDGTYKVEFYRGTVRWQSIFSSAGILLKEEHK